jgi:hypothetical protein
MKIISLQGVPHSLYLPLNPDAMLLNNSNKTKKKTSLSLNANTLFNKAKREQPALFSLLSMKLLAYRWVVAYKISNLRSQRKCCTTFYLISVKTAVPSLVPLSLCV